ncbi:glycine betaine transporter [Natronoarchaeum philippinense]|uniref:Glycine betaine transporter n=1 Tax=Natronoarchaeum philippinense TaxID=558529 RepID=A0A285P607_NATPI|nr:BCCT family transporter [Natronoarchaeum philippinense]SNZ16878.1 glycine betaine transporter [Natronoarchaeum philippinense]
MSTDSQGRLAAFRDEIDPFVFVGGALVTIIAIGYIAARPTTAAEMLTNANNFLWSELGWLFLWAMFLAVVFCLWLLIGPWGKIKFGGPDTEPEFSYFSFLAMLFSAGLSTGLVFYGPAEALFHFSSGPPFFGAEAQSAAIVPDAVQYTMLHWGISPWAAYLVVGITIAYYVHRKGAPIKPSTVFAPFIGVENLDKKWVKPLDLMMVVISVGGVAVSLGFVVTQFLAGLNYNYGVEFGNLGTILVTVGLTVGFTASAALGVKRGIRRVSTFNMYLFTFLLAVAFVFGPTAFLLSTGTQALGGYVNDFVSMSLYMNAANGGTWVGGWTVFYWAWWFSFAPMIGIFITRICRGRTIRQVVFAGLVGTTAASFPWFIVMGGSSLWVQTQGSLDLLSIVFAQGREVAAFPLFETLMPFGGIFAVAYLVLVLTFLITTVDSTTLSLAMFTTDGSENPSTANRVTWGGLVGLLSSLLLISGGLAALKDFVVLLGFPIAFVIGMCIVGLTIEFEQLHPVLLTERYEGDAPEDDDQQTVAGLLSDRRPTWMGGADD